jgi:putative adhesin
MSNEEMQFADPEWQPPGLHSSAPEQEPFDPQPVNAPHDEQPGWQSPPQEESDGESDYYAGYRAQQQRSYTVPPRQQRRGRTRPWFWVILVLIILTFLGGRPFFIEGGSFVEGFVLENFLFGVLFLGILVAVIALLRSRGRSRITFSNTRTVETRNFVVGKRPTIIVKDDIGTIRVRSSGENNEVQVQAIKHSKGWTGNYNNLQVDYDQRAEDNTITIKSVHGRSIFGKNSVDYDITVPLIADLELRTDVGKIYVSDVIGQMTLVSDAGSIHATQVSLQGQSRLKTDVGSLNFSGSIDAQGTYKFEADAGSINVTLPEDASFHVDARTEVGSINSEFAISGQSRMSRAKLSGNVGNPPYATLTLQTDLGSINLKRG